MAERFAEDGYKIIQSVEIGGMEIVIADNPQAEKPYLMTRRSLDEAFGAEDFIIPVYSSDYPETFVSSSNANPPAWTPSP